MSSSAPQSIADAEMPAWTMAGAPTRTTVVAAAGSPTQISRARVNVSPSSVEGFRKVMPAWTRAGPPTSAAVVAAAGQPGTEWSCSCEHVGSFSAAAMCRRRYFGATTCRGWPEATPDSAPPPDPQAGRIWCQADVEAWVRDIGRLP